MMMDKSSDHTPSVPAWTTLELDPSIVSFIYSVTDEEALEAFKRVSRLEGIIPALETCHALAHLEKLCPTLPDGTRVVLNFSGRGDKDVQTKFKEKNTFVFRL